MVRAGDVVAELAGLKVGLIPRTKLPLPEVLTHVMGVVPVVPPPLTRTWPATPPVEGKFQ